MVTDRIVEEMAKGIIPWRKPWSGAKLDAADAAISYVTRRAYSVLNQWLLGRPGEYLTFNQVKEQGGSIKRGAKSRFVVFYTKVSHVEKDAETGEEKVVSYPLLKYYNVFHIDDCEGIKSKCKPGDKVEVASEVETIAEADAVIAAYVEREAGFKFYNDTPSNEAYYSPAGDYVKVPDEIAVRAHFRILFDHLPRTRPLHDEGKPLQPQGRERALLLRESRI